MTKSNQKKLLILFSALLFTGFLFFFPRGIYAGAPVWTAGWYEDKGTGEIDAACPAGYWRASIELRNDLREPLLADKLTIRAIWYEKDTDIGVEIYRTEAVNLTSHIFETDCAIDIKNADGTIALEVTAEKASYYKMKAANNSMTGGSAFNQKKWKKILYLAPLAGTEIANIAYLFPGNNEWISAREEHSAMKLWVNKAPLPDNITRVDAEIIHLATGQKFSLSQTTNIAEGEVIFRLPALTQHGYYGWRIKLTRSTPSIFYNENAVSFFNFDPNPPINTQLLVTTRRSGKLQALNVNTQFKDEPLPSSGICRIEVYLNDGPSTPFELVKTCTGSLGGSAWCNYVGPYQEYLVPKTYTTYAVAYDCVGNKTQTEQKSRTINPINPSTLNILSSVDQKSVTGVSFQVTNIDVINGVDAPATGTYQTTKSFVSTADRYDITLQAPDSHNGRRFSFWQYSLYCYNNPLEWTVPYGYSYNLTMQFGVSRFMLDQRQQLNTGSISDSLKDQIDSKITKVEQIGGSPADLLGPTGYRDHTSNADFYKTVTAEINNLVLRFNDSADGILKFSYVYSSNWSGTLDPEDTRQWQGSLLSFRCGRIYPRYLIQRTVRVETYLGSNLVGGVGIIGNGGMKSGTTTAGGYYTFSSTGTQASFTGTLRAPEFIIDNDGKKVEFGYWTGCESVSADKLGCYIGTGVTWFYNVNATVKAHYTSEPDPEMPFLSVYRNFTGGGDGTVTSPSGICCGCAPTSICSSYFTTSTLVILTATSAANSYFVGWTGDCSSTNPICTISMDSYREVWAEFALKPVLTVNITGNGTVISNPAGINCIGPDTCSATFNPSSTVSLTADPDSYWEFTGWTGAVTSTLPTISLFMNEDKTVNTLFESLGPTAAMGCECTPSDCGGPGCVCTNTPATWVTYRGAIFNLLNKSTLPDPAISYTSEWYYNGTQFTTCTENGTSTSICNTTASNIPGAVPPDTETLYTIRLVVEDAYGASSTATHDLIVKNDIFADFDCSLASTTGPWQNCTSVAPLVGQTVYFRDISTPSSGGGVINYWLWEKGYRDGFGNFVSSGQFASTSIASTALTTAIDTVRLTVRDQVPREASVTKPLTVSLPLPKYREVAPIGRLDNFLARLTNIFARF